MKCSKRGCRNEAEHNDGRSRDSFCDEHYEQQVQATCAACDHAWIQNPGGQYCYKCGLSITAGSALRA